MDNKHDFPVILALSMAIVVAIIGLSREFDFKNITIMVIVVAGVFFVLGLGIKQVIFKILKELDKKKEDLLLREKIELSEEGKGKNIDAVIDESVDESIEDNIDANKDNEVDIVDENKNTELEEVEEKEEEKDQDIDDTGEFQEYNDYITK